MSEFNAAFTDGLGVAIALPALCTFTPLSYSKEAVGGFDAATIRANGPREALWFLLNILGYRAYIYNRNQTLVWHGRITEVLISIGGVQVGLSLKAMRNYVAVAYTTTENGAVIRGTTAWAGNTESINRFGYQELLSTLSNGTAIQAAAKRDATLNTIGVPTRMPVASATDQNATGTIRCSGFYETLGQRYYSQPSGYEAYDTTGSNEQVLGQVMSGTTIGFTRSGRIDNLAGGMDNYRANSKIQVTGSASNNVAAKVGSTTVILPQSYASTTISFDADDDIDDTHGDMVFIGTDEYFTITGATNAANNGTKRLSSGKGDHLQVHPKTIVNETQSSPHTITIARGNSIGVTGALASEFPGASVTLTTHGVRMAQSFSLPVSVSWPLYAIAIKARRVGAPVDSLQIQLCADAAGVPGTVLATGTVVGSTLGTNFDWINVVMTGAVTITYGTTYWIVVTRTGANSASVFYIIAVDETLTYPRGLLKVWDGAGYVARDPDAEMLFRVSSVREHSLQLADIITASGQFLTGVDVIDTTGISTVPYRVGGLTAQAEVERLVESGYSTGERMLVDVTSDLKLRIKKRPVSSADQNLLMGSDGRLLNMASAPLEPGVLPAGRWVDIQGIPPNVGALTGLSPFFVERAEFDCTANQLRLEPEGTPDAFSIGDIQPG